MRIGLFVLTTCLFPILIFASQSFASDSFTGQLSAKQGSSSQNATMDYCYKPVKPLLLAKKYHKQRYAEAMQEYQRCVRHFSQFQENLVRMKEESERNSRSIMGRYTREH